MKIKFVPFAKIKSMAISMRFLTICCLSLLAQPLKAQTDSSQQRISLLTCGPGEDLYSIWGHTAIRVIDTAQQADIVFNYGTFDDSDPLFYIKFTRGIMIYSVAPYAFTDFIQTLRHFLIHHSKLIVVCSPSIGS